MGREIRDVLVLRMLWGMLVALSLLVGFSFFQAVKLFSQASQTALSYPALAAGMNPLEGIFIPTFGAYYLVETLLLPFVVIRFFGQDKLNGALKLLLQMPFSPFFLNAVKLSAMICTGVLFLLPGTVALLLWHHAGGAVFLPEILTLVLGHVLYSLTIICIAMFAVALSDSLPGAAMMCLAVTLGSWVLDFAASRGGWISGLSKWSLTTLLDSFESGLLSTVSITSFCAFSLFFFIASAVLIHPGTRIFKKWKRVFIAGLVLFLLVLIAVRFPGYRDVTENRVHSFNPADEAALKQMEKHLKITVHLSRDDSRYYDLDHEVLSKLRRLVPDLEVIFADTEPTEMFASSGGDKYGLIEYDYAGKHDESYSNSEQEILPLIHTLAGRHVEPAELPPYSGHPLVVDLSGSEWLFYLIMPILFFSAAVWFQRPQFFHLLIKEKIK